MFSTDRKFKHTRIYIYIYIYIYISSKSGHQKQWSDCASTNSIQKKNFNLYFPQDYNIVSVVNESNIVAQVFFIMYNFMYEYACYMFFTNSEKSFHVVPEKLCLSVVETGKSVWNTSRICQVFRCNLLLNQCLHRKIFLQAFLYAISINPYTTGFTE